MISEEIFRYLDGSLSAEETEAFGRRLLEDSKLRAEFLEVSEQAVFLGDISRGFQLTDPIPFSSGQEAKKQKRRFRHTEIWAAAATVILSLGMIFWLTRHDAASEPIATLEFADGKVRWADSEGKMVENPAAGFPLGVGTLFVDSSDGAVQIRFEDNTVLTFGGETEAHLSEREARKWIVLDQGTVTAEVSEQPDRSPLTLITPTAEIEVLGTILSVSADRAETALTVDEGLVAIRHLLNGERIEVPAGQQVIASLNPELPMEPKGKGKLLSHWRLDRSNPEANLVTKGQWKRIDERRCLEGEFYVARQEKDGVLIRRGVAINGPVRMGTPYVQLGPDSVFRMRYRTDVPSDGGVSVFLGTQRLNGGFGGNFTSWISEPESRELEDGFREVVIPIADFKLNSKIRERGDHYDLVENALSKILVSVSEDHQLHIAHVSVENGPIESE